MNIALVGYGYWGNNYVRVFNELPNSRVTAICDLDKARLFEAARRHPSICTFQGLPEMLSQEFVDAVVVCTPATTHYEVTKLALLSNKHVLVEKPMTTEAWQGEELIELADAKRLTLMVGHTFLFNPGIVKMKDWMAHPEFGQMYYLHATRTNLGPVRRDVDASWDLAAHDISIFEYLLDKQPDWASAMGARVLGNHRVDVAFITLGYGDGTIGNIHVSWADPNKVREVVVVGSNRRILFDDLSNFERVKVFEKGVSTTPSRSEGFGEFQLLVRDGDIISPKVEISEPLKNQCVHFLQCVETGGRPLTSGERGLAVVRVLEAVQESMATNGASVRIRVPARTQ